MYHFYFHIYIYYILLKQNIFERNELFFQVKATHRVPHSPFACHVTVPCTGERLGPQAKLVPHLPAATGTAWGLPLLLPPGKKRCLPVPPLQSQRKAFFIAPSYTPSPSRSAGRDWGVLEGWGQEVGKELCETPHALILWKRQGRTRMNRDGVVSSICVKPITQSFTEGCHQSWPRGDWSLWGALAPATPGVWRGWLAA